MDTDFFAQWQYLMFRNVGALHAVWLHYVSASECLRNAGPFVVHPANEAAEYVGERRVHYDEPPLCKKATKHHANLPLEMYSFTL